MKQKLLLIMIMIFSLQSFGREQILGCIRDEALEQDRYKEVIISSLKKRMSVLKKNRKALIERQKLTEHLNEDWEKATNYMVLPSFFSFVIPGVAIGKLTAAINYSNVARTAYATRVISESMFDYYLVGSMTSILFGGILLPQVVAAVKYNSPKIEIKECTDNKKIIVHSNYSQLKNALLKRAEKNNSLMAILSSKESELVQEFSPGFWHFISNTLTFGFDESKRLENIMSLQSDQLRLIDLELNFLDQEIIYITQMKSCSQACELSVD